MLPPGSSAAGHVMMVSYSDRFVKGRSDIIFALGIRGIEAADAVAEMPPFPFTSWFGFVPHYAVLCIWPQSGSGSCLAADGTGFGSDVFLFGDILVSRRGVHALADAGFMPRSLG